MSAEIAGPFYDPTLAPLRVVIDSMRGNAGVVADSPRVEYVPVRAHDGAICQEVADSPRLSLLDIELASALRAASGFITSDETVRFQAELWRSELWCDIVSNIIGAYEEDPRVTRPDYAKPRALFDWGSARVSLSIHGDVVQVAAWDRPYTDDEGISAVEDYLGMLTAQPKNDTSTSEEDASLQEFAKARGLRVLRVKSRTPLLSIPVALHILDQTAADGTEHELTPLVLTDEAVTVVHPGIFCTPGPANEYWKVTDSGSIVRLHEDGV